MQFKKLEVVARDGQIRRERIWTCAACPQGEGHGRPESINHRHADFQHNGEAGSVRASRRPGRDFSLADRTAPRDRTFSEPRTERVQRGPARPPPRRRCPSRGHRRTPSRARRAGSLRLAAALSGPVRAPGRRLTTNSPPTSRDRRGRMGPVDQRSFTAIQRTSKDPELSRTCRRRSRHSYGCTGAW